VGPKNIETIRLSERVVENETRKHFDQEVQIFDQVFGFVQTGGRVVFRAEISHNRFPTKSTMWAIPARNTTPERGDRESHRVGISARFVPSAFR